MNSRAVMLCSLLLAGFQCVLTLLSPSLLDAVVATHQQDESATPPTALQLDWQKFLPTPTAELAPATEQQVQELAAGLQARVNKLEGHQLQGVTFALAMTSQYPVMAAAAQNILYQQLKLWHTILSFNDKGEPKVYGEVSVPVTCSANDATGQCSSGTNESEYSVTLLDRQPLTGGPIKLIVSERNITHLYDADTFAPQHFLEESTFLNAIDYHYEKKILFYTRLGVLYRAHFLDDFTIINETQIASSTPPGIAYFSAIAVDWVNDNVYWSWNVGSTTTMFTAELDGSNQRKLFDKDTKFAPTSLSVDPYEGILFVGHSLGVDTYNLKGDEPRTILPRGHRQGMIMRFVWFMTVDRQTRRIYITGKEHDLKEKTQKMFIAHTDYEGKDFQHVMYLKSEENTYSRMVVFNNYLFYINKDKNSSDSLWRVDLLSANHAARRNQIINRSYPTWRGELRVFHPCEQKQADDKNCSADES